METNITQLILKSLDGTIVQAEQQQLNKWRQSSVSNEMQYQQIEHIWKQAADLNYPVVNGEIDTVKAYEKVKSRVSPPRLSIVRKYRSFLQAAAVFLVISIFAGIVFYGDENSDERVLIEARLGRTEVKLPDDSIVWLEEGAVLSYQKQFEEERNLNLKGSAFFEVTHNDQSPFVVSTESLDVIVLGTKFIIADGQFSGQSVDVVEGRVKVQEIAEPDNSVILTKGLSAELRENGRLELSNRINNNDMFWATQYLNYRSEPLVQVFDDLSKYYKISIDYNKSDFAGCEFQGNFNRKSFEEILSYLQLIYNLDFERIEESSYKISGRSCK